MSKYLSSAQERLSVCMPAIIAATMLLNGCSSPNTVKDIWGVHEPYSAVGVCKYAPKDYLNGNFRKAYEAAIASTNFDKARMERNQILNELLLRIDADNGRYELALNSGRRAYNVAGSLAVLGLTTASTLTGGKELKTILSAVATAVEGVNLSVTKEVFMDKTMQAVTAQMQANRVRRRAEISLGMRNSVIDYPLEVGLADVWQYYLDGSLTRALNNLIAEAQSRANQTDTKQSLSAGFAFTSRTSSNIVFLDTSTGSITNRHWNFGDGSQSDTNVVVLEHAYTLATNGTKNVSVSLTVSGTSGPPSSESKQLTLPQAARQ